MMCGFATNAGNKLSCSGGESNQTGGPGPFGDRGGTQKPTLLRIGFRGI